METKQDYQSDYIGSLIQEGFYDKLVIIGYPYDEGAKKNGARGGSDYGPGIQIKKLQILDSFRRFVKEIGVIHNSEYGVDISKGLPKISDYGNIMIPTQPPNPPASLQQLQEKLTTKVGLCIKRSNMVFVVGGSRDQFGAVSDALLKQSAEGNTFVSINHSLDVKWLLDLGIPHQSSNKRYLLEKMNPESNKLIEFGMNGQNVSQSDMQYFQSKNPRGEIVWMKDIRKYKVQSDYKGIAESQAGQLFESLIERIKDDKQVHLSINLENIQGAPGVSSQCTNGGVRTEEILEICYLAGLKMKNLVALDISEFNPFVEDWRTGRLLASMFYHFVLGMSQRLQN